MLLDELFDPSLSEETEIACDSSAHTGAELEGHDETVEGLLAEREEMRKVPGTGAEGLSTLVNAFGPMIAFVYWVYDLSIVLALGAIVASLHEHRHVTAGSLPEDESPVVHDPPPVSDDETEPAQRDLDSNAVCVTACALLSN